jgi:glutamate synthase domain-containing protein 3
MSGGIAYVLDLVGVFPAKCNMELVDLEDPTDADFEELYALIKEHRDRTDSPVAERVLGDWEAHKSSWVKVFPRDYKRVLREAAERAALTQDGAMAAAVAGGIEEQAIPAQG